MSAREQTGEKTEQPTPRRLEDAIKQGQFARSAEVQTVFVLGAALIALKFTGTEIWSHLVRTQYSVLGHLHEIPISMDVMQRYAAQGALVFAGCVAPVVLATMAGGMLAGGIQSRFQTAGDATEIKWDRVNPLNGMKRLFSIRSTVPTIVGILKLSVVASLTYSQAKDILSDPIFFSAVDTARIAAFLAEASGKLLVRVGLALMVLAAADYAYQFWQTGRDLMMTKEEVKEEMKNSEGNPEIKARQRRRRRLKTQRQMLREVPKADVIVTNPTHLAVALRYDRKTMKAPTIVAKGARLNALKIREVAAQHQVPIVENKPLARLMFKYGRVGGEIPAQLYAAVAEVLAWVYRVNRYRYYAEQNQT
jgi:flagellar biosynthesis protein FlhB